MSKFAENADVSQKTYRTALDMLDVALSLGAPANIEPQSCPNVIAPKHSSDTRNPLFPKSLYLITI